VLTRTLEGEARRQGGSLCLERACENTGQPFQVLASKMKFQDKERITNARGELSRCRLCRSVDEAIKKRVTAVGEKKRGLKRWVFGSWCLQGQIPGHCRGALRHLKMEHWHPTFTVRWEDSSNNE